jgi:hypothetical protein
MPKLEKTIGNYLKDREVQALVKVYPADDLLTGISTLVKAYGFGPVEPNTILLGETGGDKNLAPFAALIKTIHETQLLKSSLKYTIKNCRLLRQKQKRKMCKEFLQGGIFPLVKRSDYFLFPGAVHLLDSNTFCYILAVNLCILDYHLVSGHNISKGLLLCALFYNSFLIC